MLWESSFRFYTKFASKDGILYIYRLVWYSTTLYFDIYEDYKIFFHMTCARA